MIVAGTVYLEQLEEPPMHEQSSSHQTRAAILDHPVVQGMDAHERSSLSEKLKGMSNLALYNELRRIREL